MTSRPNGVAMLLAELREELLVAPDAEMMNEHVCAMELERRLLTPARRSGAARVPIPVRVRRIVESRPRRVVAVLAAACLVSGALTLDAAAEVPGAIRHITDHITNSIVHTFGVPQAPHEKAAAALPGTQQSPSVTRSIGSTPGFAGATGVQSSVAPTQGTSAGASPPTSSDAVSPPSTQPTTGPPGGHGTPSPPPSGTKKPPKKNMQKDPNTPPGFPSDWRSTAITAARWQLIACTQAVAPAPVGCPQQLTVDTGLTPGPIQWTVLNQPLAGAVAVAQLPAAGNAANHSAGTVVEVFGLFQMSGAYTVASDPGSERWAYSGGVAEATLTWNGSRYEQVTFATGPVTGSLPTGVIVPNFARPGTVTDSVALTAVHDGFTACAARANPADPTLANCPQRAAADPGATTAQWSLTGDPTQGAVVTFDPAHGDFIVSGTYTMVLTTDSGASPVTVNAPYAATLAFANGQLELLGISGA